MNRPLPDDLLTLKQLASQLNNQVTVQTLSTWCRTGKIRARRIGLKWFIRWADFEAFQISNEGGSIEGKTNALAA
jgi:hypothetical protein